MGKYTTDKERMDTITDKIANREPIKEWAAIYWMAVAIGHLLEWVVKTCKADGKKQAMTEVLCTFNECNYYKPHDEDYGICTKDRIILDEEVSGRTCGCPDAEWKEPQTERSE